MPIKIDELRYILGLDSSGFFSSLRKAQAGADNTRKDVEKPINLKANVQNVVDGFARVGLALQGFQQVKNLILGPGQELINLSNTQEKAEAKLAAVIQATGGAAGFTADQLKAYASELQNLTTFGDEQIIPFMAQLGTFTNITGQEFKRATALALDMSDIFGGDLKSAALQLGKALNDPVSGVSALSRVGVQFTDVQKEQIANFQNQNDIIGAQTVILDELQRQFGGVAEAIAQTDAGQLQQFENAVGDAKEVLGALLKDVLVPLTQILRPVVEGFASLGDGSRNATLATTAFLAVAIKAPAVFGAIRVALVGLQTSMGPAGWLLLALGALTTAFTAFASSVEDTADEVSALKQELGQLNEQQIIGKLNNITATIAQLNAEMAKVQSPDLAAEYEKRIKDLRAQQQVLINALQQQQVKEKAERDAHNQQLTEDQIRELDKRREYEFQTNRISLADYIAYLESRTEAQRAALGGDSVDFLKFVDNISALRQRLAQESGKNVDSLDLQVRLPDQSALDQLTEFYGEYRNIQLEFEELGYQDLLTAYDTKQLLFDENLNYLRQKEGEQSEAYQAELKRREQMQINYNASRIRLEQQALRTIASLGSQLVTAFAGQSKTLFEIGKGLAIANTTVTTYEAIARAYKDYPWPFNLGIAAIQAALGFAQVANIKSTQFESGISGKAEGGRITQADIVQSIFTPSGESGIIGIQTGEFVVNRQATTRFLPLLESINSGQDIRGLPAFADGGIVVDPQPAINAAGATSQPLTQEININAIAGIIQDAIIDGFERSKVQINGNLIGDGKELQTVLDKYAALKADI